MGNDTASNTILIVDDDPVNRKILGKIFSGYYEIREAEDGLKGLAEILDKKNSFCAVLMDVLMPGMTGIEVLRCLGRYGTADAIPIFLITSESGRDVIREAYDLGVMDVINKPVVPYVVLRRVRSVIELFEARRHLSCVVQDQNILLLEQAKKIIELNQGMIEALATAIEFRSKESGEHIRRISGITRLLLTDTDFGNGLDGDEINRITTAAVMHDVGKITIPDAVLLKPGKLTQEEYEIMKTHTTKGVELLESIPQMRESGIYEYACDIARHHHERWDGGGYPDGLKGDAITPWSQAVALADVYDALISGRVYKPSFTEETAVDMILTGQCGQFNPALLDGFLSVRKELYEIYEVLTKK